MSARQSPHDTRELSIVGELALDRLRRQQQAASDGRREALLASKNISATHLVCCLASLTIACPELAFHRAPRLSPRPSERELLIRI